MGSGRGQDSVWRILWRSRRTIRRDRRPRRPTVRHRGRQALSPPRWGLNILDRRPTSFAEEDGQIGGSSAAWNDVRVPADHLRALGAPLSTVALSKRVARRSGNQMTAIFSVRGAARRLIKEFRAARCTSWKVCTDVMDFARIVEPNILYPTSASSARSLRQAGRSGADHGQQASTSHQ
jgi:hypothetical protein